MDSLSGSVPTTDPADHGSKVEAALTCRCPRATARRHQSPPQPAAETTAAEEESMPEYLDDELLGHWPVMDGDGRTDSSGIVRGVKSSWQRACMQT